MTTYKPKISGKLSVQLLKNESDTGISHSVYSINLVALQIQM